MTLSPDCTFRQVHAGDAAAISALHARVFGPGRFARAAYRVREGLASFSPFCRVALLKEQIIAACRFAPITIGGEAGAIMLGPLAVEPAHANLGYGRRLIREGHDAARGAGIRLVVLVGDVPYYARLGFVQVPPGQMTMPGPIDSARLLALELSPGVLDGYTGMIAGDQGVNSGDQGPSRTP